MPKQPLPDLLEPNPYNPELDAQLFEAIRTPGEDLLNRLMKAHGLGMDNHWATAEQIPTDAVHLATNRKLERPELSPAIASAVILFLLTEDGITYYPRDVGRIFNPLHRRPESYAKNDTPDPFEYFSRLWTSQEFQHATGSELGALVLGLDRTQIEQMRYKFVADGIFPSPVNSPRGMAYTALQEANTATPYTNLIKALRQDQKAAAADGYEDWATILEATIQFYGRVARDERLHHSFITGSLRCALQVDDPNLASRTLVGVHDELIATIFDMPGKNMPDFRRMGIAIMRAGIFTPSQSEANKVKLLREELAVPALDVSNMSDAAKQAQQNIVTYLDKAA